MAKPRFECLGHGSNFVFNKCRQRSLLITSQRRCIRLFEPATDIRQSINLLISPASVTSATEEPADVVVEQTTTAVAVTIVLGKAGRNENGKQNEKKEASHDSKRHQNNSWKFSDRLMLLG
jgi:hypothetical protein